jgi:hypothetical protein
MTELHELFVKAGNLVDGKGSAWKPSIDIEAWIGLFGPASVRFCNEDAWQKLETQYLLRHVRCGAKLKPHKSTEIVRLIGWAASVLVDWSLETDPAGKKLAIVLAIAMTLDVPLRAFWGLASSVKKIELFCSLGSYLATTEVGIEAPLSFRASDKAFLAVFKRAVAQGDWIEIAQNASHVFDNVCDLQLSFIAEFLSDVASNELLAICRNVKSCLTAYVVLDRLSLADGVRLTLNAGNDHVRFALLYSLGRGSRHSAATFTDEIQAELALVWAALARDLQSWAQWMEVFNTFPVRFVLLQKSLGLALAQTTVGAQKMYVDAISLSAGLDSRLIVADCLEAFEAAAKPTKQLTLWALAFARWKEWNFQIDKSGPLLGIRSSPLDFAVIRHIAKGMAKQQRENKLFELEAAMRKIETVWHSNFSQCRIAYNTLLSEYHFVKLGSAEPQKKGNWFSKAPCLPERLLKVDGTTHRILSLPAKLV